MGDSLSYLIVSCFCLKGVGARWVKFVDGRPGYPLAMAVNISM